MNQVRDQAVLFGPRKSLVGILTQSSAAAASPDRPAIVILNAGIIHRIGPNRMFVSLARQLAESGHLVARFDLSGIGDSEPRHEHLEPLEAAMSDIRDVLDSLAQTKQVTSVILIGLCSGADQAVVYGGGDPRIKGVVLIDPAIPRTRRYYYRHYRARLFRLTSWLNFTAGRHPFWTWLRRRVAPAKDEAGEGSPPPDLQSPEVKTFLSSAYRRAFDAGIGFLAVFTGDLESQHNYREQLLEAFPEVPFGQRLRLEYFPKTDHTFSPEADRRALLAIINDWVSSQTVAAPALARA